MRQLTCASVLAVGLAGSLSAQPPAQLSLFITADRLDGHDDSG